jgi:hypothetical protein
MASKSVCCTSTVVVSPATSSASAVKLQNTQKRNLMTLDQQIKRDLQMEYCSDKLYSPGIAAVTKKNYPHDLDSAIWHLSGPV